MACTATAPVLFRALLSLKKYMYPGMRKGHTVPSAIPGPNTRLKARLLCRAANRATIRSVSSIDRRYVRAPPSMWNPSGQPTTLKSMLCPRWSNGESFCAGTPALLIAKESVEIDCAELSAPCAKANATADKTTIRKRFMRWFTVRAREPLLQAGPHKRWACCRRCCPGALPRYLRQSCLRRAWRWP